jgi:tetratricopeptide (TPR) repeat protein
VGRDRERQRLWRDYEDAVADRTCRLFTLLGPAGIGKSRLVADFLERVGDSADVLRGRCLSYGEGITYWPLVEILVSLGVEPDSVIGTSPAETQLAFRRLLEARAAERPQVVVIDDLQWAEPVFVDLVEHIADLSRDAPIFLLCVARTELLDSRPGWGGGKLNASSLLLEPLDPHECFELMDRLVTDASLTRDLRERITTASAGNPLYVEEMLAMVREHGGGEIAVPPTIHALLQARIDSLDGDVRVVMERGSVEGEVFHRGSVAVLAPDPVRPAVESHLATLVRKELIRSTSPTFPEDEGFRFRHLLIRDAAYESLPKATRAELHERFADWLGMHDLVERDEIVGYHLEQAHHYRAELDPGDPALERLGQRAAGHLAPAGQAAMDRGDWSAARGLLRRARDLLPEGSDERAALGPDLALVLQEVGETAEAVKAADEAAGARDPVLRARGLIAQADASGFVAGADGELRARAEEARATLEEAGDQLGLAQYRRWHGYDFWARLQAARAQESWEKGLVHAAAAGVKRLHVELEINILSALYLGPTPIAEALPYAQAVLERSTPGSLAEASALRAVGYLRSCQGFVEEGRELLERGRETFRQAGLHVSAGGWAMSHSEIEWRAGDFEAQERVLREGVETLDRLGDQFFFSTVALRLADCLLQTRAPDNTEVAGISRVARERTLEADLVNFVYLDGIEARRLAYAGSTKSGIQLARSAAATADETDNFDVRSHAWYAFAETLLLAEELGEAGRAAARSVEIRAAKGDVAGAAALERRYAELGIVIA